MGKLPIDFEAKLKDPKAIAGGYPYAIKAEDLMRDFVDAKLLVDQSVHSSGLQLEEIAVMGENGYPARKIRLNPASGGATSSLHPFKVTPNADDLTKIDIHIGTVYHEVGSEVIAAQSAVVMSDLVLLKITRDATTREVTAAEVGPYSIGFAAISTKTNQYYHIATTDSSAIEQHQFQDLYVYEDLAVINGAFRYVPLAMSAANYYET